VPGAEATGAGRYVTRVAYATVRGTTDHHGTYTEHTGSAPAVPSAVAGIWAAQASGPGTQTLTWAVKNGGWMVVAMNADGWRPVSMQVNVAATLPALPWIAIGLLIGAFACLVGGVLLIAFPVRSASWPQDRA
jgi:hypothetical protein